MKQNIESHTEAPLRGFNFENCARFVYIYIHFCRVISLRILTTKCAVWRPIPSQNSNAMLASKGFATPRAIKTGTTIVGITFKDGVILGADTRATEGPIVADKNCEKIHFLAKNM